MIVPLLLLGSVTALLGAFAIGCRVTIKAIERRELRRLLPRAVARNRCAR